MFGQPRADLDKKMFQLRFGGLGTPDYSREIFQCGLQNEMRGERDEDQEERKKFLFCVEIKAKKKDAKKLNFLDHGLFHS